MLCLELAPDYDGERIESILTAAWSSFKARTPLVGVEAVPDDDEDDSSSISCSTRSRSLPRPAGRLRLRPYADGTIKDFAVRDHRGDAAVPAFAELVAQNFPNAAMNPDRFSLRGTGTEWSSPGERVPITMIQANLLRGGLVLSHLCYHAFCDGTTMHRLMARFAEDVRRASELIVPHQACQVGQRPQRGLIARRRQRHQERRRREAEEISQGMRVDRHLGAQSPIHRDTTQKGLGLKDLRRASRSAAPRSTVAARVADRAKLLRSTGQRVATDFAASHREFAHLPFTPTALPPELTAPHTGHVFQFTPEAVAALKAACAPAHARYLRAAAPPGLPAFVSTNDALNALVWRCAVRAKVPDPDAAGTPDLRDRTSLSMVAMDGRRRAHVPVHPHTLGNFLGYAAATVPLARVLAADGEPASASLADLACLMRRGVARHDDGAYMDELAHYVERMDDVSRLVPGALLDMAGSSVGTNWSEFDYYGIEWGPEFGHRIRALRFPSSGVCSGLQIIMPRPPGTPEGTVEMLVVLPDEAWPRLLRDETWNTYARNPTTVPYE